MHRASRYRLYPNQTQQWQFAQLCGAGRFVYNELLGEQIREYSGSILHGMPDMETASDPSTMQWNDRGLPFDFH